MSVLCGIHATGFYSVHNSLNQLFFDNERVYPGNKLCIVEKSAFLCCLAGGMCALKHAVLNIVTEGTIDGVVILFLSPFNVQCPTNNQL